MVEEIVHRYLALERELWDEMRNLYQKVHILIDGRDFQFLEGELGCVISPEDSISIFSAIGGGSTLHPEFEVFIGEMEFTGIISKIDA